MSKCIQKNVFEMTLAVFVLWLPAAGHACTPVAKMIFESKSQQQYVHVERSDKSAAGNKLLNDQLCMGDKVKVVKGGKVAIKYYSSKIPETLLIGEAEFPVFPAELKSTTRSGNVLSALSDIGKWFQRGSDGEMSAYMTTRGSSSRAKSILRTPLDRGEGREYPFMLRSNLHSIHFFWRGGAAPWTVSLTDRLGKEIWAGRTDVAVIDIPLGSLNTAAIGGLRVDSSDGQAYVKKLRFENADSENSSSEQLGQIVELLYLDSLDNWRLQLSSMIYELDTSAIKSTLIDHLEKDDL